MAVAEVEEVVGVEATEEANKVEVEAMTNGKREANNVKISVAWNTTAKAQIGASSIANDRKTNDAN